MTVADRRFTTDRQGLEPCCPAMASQILCGRVVYQHVLHPEREHPAFAVLGGVNLAEVEVAGWFCPYCGAELTVREV